MLQLRSVKVIVRAYVYGIARSTLFVETPALYTYAYTSTPRPPRWQRIDMPPFVSATSGGRMTTTSSMGFPISVL